MTLSVPTFEKTDTFAKDHRNLDEADRKRFSIAVKQFVDDLSNDRNLRPGLRVKRVQGTARVWEMTWANDGRATFEYGDELLPGQPHVVWRRVGTHDIFRRP